MRSKTSLDVVSANSTPDATDDAKATADGAGIILAQDETTLLAPGMWTVTAIGQTSNLQASYGFSMLFPAMSLSFSCNPCSLGQATTMTSTLKNANPSLYSGSVGSGDHMAFYDRATAPPGATPLGAVSVIRNNDGSGTAIFTTALGGGAHAIVPFLAPTDNFFFWYQYPPGYETGLANLTVNKAATSTSLTALPNPVRASSGLTLNAQVAFVTGFPPTGTVTFFDGSTPIGASSISAAGTATLFRGLAAGTHSITAQYSGDSNYLASTSPAVSVVSNPKIAPSFSFTTTPSPVYTGVPVTLSLAISVAGATPYGSVDFFDGFTKLGTVAVGPGNMATLGVTFAAGSHSLTGQYSGNPDVLPGTPAVLNLLVNPKLTATIAVTASPNPVHAGNDITITATVSFPPGSVKPTGTVTFKTGSTAVGTAPIDTVFSNTSVGVVVKVRTGAAGTYSLSATYNGDLAYDPVTSPHVTLTVF